MSYATSSTSRLVGEKIPLMGPAPAKIVAPAPDAAWFVFQRRLNVYVCPAVIRKTVWPNAALGENVPPNPPLSFHASNWGAPPLSLTWMPRSWFRPALAVNRSAPAPINAYVVPDGLRLT